MGITEHFLDISPKATTVFSSYAGKYVEIYEFPAISEEIEGIYATTEKNIDTIISARKITPAANLLASWNIPSMPEDRKLLDKVIRELSRYTNYAFTEINEGMLKITCEIKGDAGQSHYWVNVGNFPNYAEKEGIKKYVTFSSLKSQESFWRKYQIDKEMWGENKKLEKYATINGSMVTIEKSEKSKNRYKTILGIMTEYINGAEKIELTQKQANSIINTICMLCSGMRNNKDTMRVTITLSDNKITIIDGNTHKSIKVNYNTKEETTIKVDALYVRQLWKTDKPGKSEFIISNKIFGFKSEKKGTRVLAGMSKNKGEKISKEKNVMCVNPQLKMRNA